MIVSIEEILELRERLREINALPLDDITFIENGDKTIVADFKFTGLNNCDFITTNFYKVGFGN
jgi:chromosomal replication initiation ATPase DnaA